MSELDNMVARVLRAGSCLTVYRKIFGDPILHGFREVLELTQKRESPAVEKYFSLLGSLMDLQKSYNLPGIDIFKNHLLDTMLSVENSFSLAVEWVMWHNSRSGRTARQFVNDLKGRLDLER